MSVPRKRPGYVMRKGNWICQKCSFHNFDIQNVCKECGDSKCNGLIMDKTNMHCVRWRKKRKKKAQVMSSELVDIYNDDITLHTRLKEWSEVNPYGKVVKVEMDKCIWPQYLIHRGIKGIKSGAKIHTNLTKWKYFKINLGTATKLKDKEWLGIKQDAKCRLNIVARQCISAALSTVAQYNDCDRTLGSHGAVWSMPCGRAFELCALIYQPEGALQQWVHKDGHMKYTLPDNEEIVYYSYFLNVIVPLKGDIPTLFRGNDRKLHASSSCGNDEIRVFNGGAWHAGAANETGEGVWKLFLGLVPENYIALGSFPIFEDDVGKSAAKQKDRILLLVNSE